MKPTRPLQRGGPAAPIPGRYKLRSRDFFVEEIPLYQPSGEGTHTYLLIEKEGIPTMEAVSRLAGVLGRRQRDFGYAGLKDAQAVARQWISIDGVDPQECENLEIEGLRVREVSRHRNKIKMGHLRGNRFSILIDGVGSEHATAAKENLQDMARRGVPNHFGEQRFGKRGSNLEKGRKILEGNPRKAAGRMPRRLLNLIISAVQSEVFNRVVNARIETLGSLLDGDVAWLHRNGASFLVEDLVSEQIRCDSFEISPSGPLPGPKLLRPQGMVAEIEERVMKECEIEPEIFARMPHGTHPGARRPLRVPVRDPKANAEPEGLRVTFELPRGSYATSVLRELLEATPWFE
ncbi:MAG: tRNA pseudouridine(13) synthase TruD [Planctomycetota bacterium]|nr:tRNA pseudouridine(13) synthase TruD [Planctomycetota bacterium]